MKLFSTIFLIVLSILLLFKLYCKETNEDCNGYHNISNHNKQYEYLLINYNNLIHKSTIRAFLKIKKNNFEYMSLDRQL